MKKISSLFLILLLLLLTGCATSQSSQNTETVVGKVEQIDATSVTLQLGALSEGADSSKNLSEYFTPEDKEITLTVPDGDKMPDTIKVGDVVIATYDSENKLTNLKAQPDSEAPSSSIRHFGKITAIDDGTITLELGNIHHTENDHDDASEVQDHLSQDFTPIAGEEPVTLTVPSDISLENFKVGDIVSFRYSDENLLESIHVPYGRVGERQYGQIESIENDKVTLLTGKIDQTKGGGSPTENFVAGTEKITLTSPDPANQLNGLKVGDVVVVRYNDQNQIQEIHVPGTGVQGNGTGQGNGSGQGNYHGHEQHHETH